MKTIVFLSCIVLTTTLSLKAQSVKVVSYPKFISSSLLVYSKYINWPINHKSGSFIITIIGDAETYKELNSSINNLTVGAQPITVRYYAKVTEIPDFSHILFLSDNISWSLTKALERVGAENTLIVTSGEGLLKRGAAINFISVDGLMKFEISKDNIRKRNLQIHSWLEKMAVNSL